MKDERIWELEEGLWTGDPDSYQDRIDPACLMVVPAEPHILAGEDAADAMAATPRWTEARLEQRRVSRPDKGLIVLAYRADARRPDGGDYQAHCTTSWRRFARKDWRVVQHQQTPPLLVGAPAHRTAETNPHPDPTDHRSDS